MSGRWGSRSRALSVGLSALLGLAALAAPGVVRAQVPHAMNFQGLLLDAAGQPKNGTVTLGFALYDAPAGGSALWSETQAGVPVTDGIYDVVLGATTPLDAAVFSSATRYLGHGRRRGAGAAAAAPGRALRAPRRGGGHRLRARRERS